ncbi:hypothetical protein B0H14DRAFT_3444523 [Mycena olivaceomarginata]|nr:hypothetical protein B0H14DRAFT_3444523 [Mycena olivaceomarginata]
MVVIRDAVDDAQARPWKASLEEFIKANPQAEGLPDSRNEKSSSSTSSIWTKPQIQARGHPNMLAASTWLNGLYHIKTG